MSRIRSRRADGQPTTAEPAADESVTTEQPTVAAPDAAAEPAPDEQATAVAPAVDAETGAEPAPEQPGAETSPTEVATVAAGDGVPAGAELEPSGPSFRDRGKLRRRLRYLRRVRELGFRDLGGLVFDLDRFGRERPDLVRAKLDALGAIDRELRGLETALGDERPVEELQEPGIAACAHCGTIHGSDARFCPGCGRPAGSAPEPAPAEPEPAAEAAPTAEPATAEQPDAPAAEQPAAEQPDAPAGE